MAEHVVCAATDIAPGQRRIVDVAGRSIGVFNVHGRFYALNNGCPHKGGALCAGPITGMVLPTSGREFVYGREGEIVRCSRHGWEFEIATGKALADPRVRARTYPVSVEAGRVVVTL
ncbi:MAG TPA: Rieske (2Fe-2S) protein [Solirubrobacteraceae bacterium]|nr:Rieske (2Fe-2S) protein [Solirubrobacteraceae bacterium]